MAPAATIPTVSDQAAQLQALLHDEPLQQVPPGASAIGGPGIAATARLAAAPAAATSGPPISAWNFDDCSPFLTRLFEHRGQLDLVVQPA